METLPCILTVDDDVSVLDVLQRVLEPAGFKVIPVTNGEAALEVLTDMKPDLVLLDVMMPGLNGFRVLEQIRACSNIPVIMLTGQSGQSTLRDTMMIGADDFVAKPFRNLELVARIRAKLRRSGLVPSPIIE